jgi:hypothetical protein
MAEPRNREELRERAAGLARELVAERFPEGTEGHGRAEDARRNGRGAGGGETGVRGAVAASLD